MIRNEELKVVYPEQNALILIPKKLSQQYAKVECRASSTTSKDIMFWFLDGEFIKKTMPPHKIHLDLKDGHHTLLINNSIGNKDEVTFKVVRRG